MISQSVHITLPARTQKEELYKGCYLVILHALRIPPHVGLLFNGKYSSLTIKGREENIGLDALLKTIEQRSIASYFIRLKDHPVFSTDHLGDMFVEHLRKYTQVKQYEASCLSPIRALFAEFYHLPGTEETLFPDFISYLKKNDLLLSYHSFHIADKSGVSVPHYTLEELNQRIEEERKPYYRD